MEFNARVGRLIKSALVEHEEMAHTSGPLPAESKKAGSINIDVRSVNVDQIRSPPENMWPWGKLGYKPIVMPDQRDIPSARVIEVLSNEESNPVPYLKRFTRWLWYCRHHMKPKFHTVIRLLRLIYTEVKGLNNCSCDGRLEEITSIAQVIKLKVDSLKDCECGAELSTIKDKQDKIALCCQSVSSDIQDLRHDIDRMVFLERSLAWLPNLFTLVDDSSRKPCRRLVRQETL